MKKFIAFVAAMVLVLSLAACQSPLWNIGKEDTPKDGDTIVDPNPQGEEVELALYFANHQYIQTGDDSLDKLLVERRKVTVTDKPLAEVAIEELMKGPRQDNLSPVIPSKLDLIGVEVADNIAYVNFSGTNMSGGSMEESFLVDSIILTLTELEGIQSVQFLVDGKKPETLMGHIYTMEPMGREDTVMKHNF